MKRFTITVITFVTLCAVMLSFVSPIMAEDVTLRFTSWLGMEGASKETLETMITEFEKANPGIKIELIGIPYEQMNQQTTISVAAGDAPDVMQLVPQWVVSLAAMGAFEDLSAYYTSAETDGIPAAAFNDGMINGKLVSVPWQLGSIFVLAWKELLNKAGYDAIPETWEEFTVAVEKISDLGDDIYGFGARTSKSQNSAFWFFPVIWGFGGQFVDEDGNVVFNSPGTLEALNWYKEISADNQIPKGMDVRETRVIFAQGKVGFIFDGPWMKGIMRNLSELGEAVDDKYIVGLFPKAADGKRYGIANNHVLAVSAQSENKEAAVKFVKFLTQNEEITEFYYDKMGAVPTYKELLADPLYKDDVFAQVVAETAEFATCIPYKHPKIGAALDYVAVAMQEAILGNDTQKALEVAEKNIKQTFGQ